MSSRRKEVIREIHDRSHASLDHTTSKQSFVTSAIMNSKSTLRHYKNASGNLSIENISTNEERIPRSLIRGSQSPQRV